MGCGALVSTPVPSLSPPPPAAGAGRKRTGLACTQERPRARPPRPLRLLYRHGGWLQRVTPFHLSLSLSLSSQRRGPTARAPQVLAQPAETDTHTVTQTGIDTCIQSTRPNRTPPPSTSSRPRRRRWHGTQWQRDWHFLPAERDGRGKLVGPGLFSTGTETGPRQGRHATATPTTTTKSAAPFFASFLPLSPPSYQPTRHQHRHCVDRTAARCVHTNGLHLAPACSPPLGQRQMRPGKGPTGATQPNGWMDGRTRLPSTAPWYVSIHPTDKSIMPPTADQLCVRVGLHCDCTYGAQRPSCVPGSIQTATGHRTAPPPGLVPLTLYSH